MYSYQKNGTTQKKQKKRRANDITGYNKMDSTEKDKKNGNNTTIYIQQTEKKTNGMGTAGFILALIALIFCWVPVIDWILWFLGTLFSIIGIFGKPKGLAITGLILSFIDILFIVFLIATIASIFATL